MRKAAFTLAEVLITLGIIGVVAAITLPTINQNRQDNELITQTKKVYADINNAILLSQQDYGVIGDNSLLFNEKDNSYIVAKNLLKYFKGAKLCQNVSQKGCKSYYYDIKYATKRVDSNGVGGVDNDTSSAKIIFSNGAILRIGTNRSGCEPKEYTSTVVDAYGRPIKNPDGTNKTHTYFSDVCANLSFDVNGTKGPNQFGRDVYWFWVHKRNLKYGDADYLGGKSVQNILTGVNKLYYENYSKGQKFDF